MDVPYWPRFYPSAKIRNDAEVIEITEGQKITDLEFPIGDEVSTRKIFVRAVWQDGTVAENVHLQIRNSKDSSNLTHQGVYTDSKGEGVLEAFLGISYQLESHATCEEMSIPPNLPFAVRPSHQERHVRELLIPASASSTHSTVIVSGPKCTLIPKFGGTDDE